MQIHIEQFHRKMWRQMIYFRLCFLKILKWSKILQLDFRVFTFRALMDSLVTKCFTPYLNDVTNFSHHRFILLVSFFRSENGNWKCRLEICQCCDKHLILTATECLLNKICDFTSSLTHLFISPDPLPLHPP